jgi:hypothetical protein
MATFDWVEVVRLGTPIGSLGFINRKIAAVTAYKKAPKPRTTFGSKLNGQILKSLEPVTPGLIGKSAAIMVFQTATDVPTLVENYADEVRKANFEWLKFGMNLVNQGIYKVYLSNGIMTIGAKGITRVTGSSMAGFILSKPMEKVAQVAILAAVNEKSAIKYRWQ